MTKTVYEASNFFKTDDTELTATTQIKEVANIPSDLKDKTNNVDLVGLWNLDQFMKRFTDGWSEEAFSYINNKIEKEPTVENALKRGGVSFANKFFGRVVENTSDIKQLFGALDDKTAKQLFNKIDKNPYKNKLLDNGFFVIINDHFKDNLKMLNRFISDITKDEAFFFYINDKSDLDTYSSFLRVFPNAVTSCNDCKKRNSCKIYASPKNSS
ncbi:MAG: hypothetical protein AAFO07_33030 [Bacteroidota bacterium]